MVTFQQFLTVDRWAGRSSFQNTFNKSDRHFGQDYRRTLPPPPDVRKVVQMVPQQMLQQISTNQQQQPDLRQIISEMRFNSEGQRIRTEEERDILMIQQCQKEQQVPLPTPVVLVISPENTMIIGDSIINCFTNPNSKWLVQCFEKTVVSTLHSRVTKNEIDVSK